MEIENPPEINGSVLRIFEAIRSNSFDDSSLKAYINSEFGGVVESSDELIKRWVNGDLIQQYDGRWTLTRHAESIAIDAEFDLSVEPESEEPSQLQKKPYDAAKLKVEQRNISVFQALRKIEKNEIILEPDFQRAFVWDEVRQSRLIESILIRIPLPAFYIDASDATRWVVVDGLQRLTTLYRFCRVPGFTLQGLEFLNELEGKNFEGLDQNYKVLIEDDTQLIFNNLLPETPAQAKFTIFSRVNTGGMQLNAQEIRHALFQGKITDKLKRIVSSNRFLVATDRAIDSKRMADRELVLRTLAFAYFGYRGYAAYDDLNGFLIHAMEHFNNEVSSSELDRLEESFLNSLESVKRIFGRYAFRKFTGESTRRGPINKAIFEAMVASLMGFNEMDLLISRRNSVMTLFARALEQDGEFYKSVTYGTGKTYAVNKRFGVIGDLFYKVGHDS